MPDTQNSFDSPLRMRVHTEFTAIGFGPVQVAPEIARLRQELNDILFQMTNVLPEPLGNEARSLISQYSGGDADFFRLFYVPIWSFLHWVPATAATSLDPELLCTARTAHALSLFLHLWDDHLCDGQLAVDLLRLQVRTLAWQRFIEASCQLCQRLAVDVCLVDEHVAKYLTSLHRPAPVSDLDGYCRRFANQVAIWTLVPRLLGLSRGEETADKLCHVIESFAISWRLLDDVQDIHLDLLNNERTAVWIGLDDAGQQRWAACHSRSIAQKALDPTTWSELSHAIHKSGCLTRLLSRINAYLLQAIQIAESQRWSGLAQELIQARMGIANAAGIRW